MTHQEYCELARGTTLLPLGPIGAALVPSGFTPPSGPFDPWKVFPADGTGPRPVVDLRRVARALRLLHVGPGSRSLKREG